MSVINIESHRGKKLMSGSDGPGGGGMEYRITRLEDDVTEIKTDMKDLRDRLSRIEGIVSKLPTMMDIFKLNIGLLIFLLTALAFGPRILALLP